MLTALAPRVPGARLPAGDSASERVGKISSVVDPNSPLGMQLQDLEKRKRELESETEEQRITREKKRARRCRQRSTPTPTPQSSSSARLLTPLSSLPQAELAAMALGVGKKISSSDQAKADEAGGSERMVAQPVTATLAQGMTVENFDVVRLQRGCSHVVRHVDICVLRGVLRVAVRLTFEECNVFGVLQDVTKMSDEEVAKASSYASRATRHLPVARRCLPVVLASCVMTCAGGLLCLAEVLLLSICSPVCVVPGEPVHPGSEGVRSCYFDGR